MDYGSPRTEGMDMVSTATERLGEGLQRGWPPGWDGPEDGELLESFLGGDDEASEAAFEALVRRHGPMVLGVCRQILDRVHDAEDAFQATFLVLARNAASIRDRRALARWLYEVAYRIAVRAKSRSARRRNEEKEAAAMSAVVVGVCPEGDPAWEELRPVLHEEVNRLPEKYRSAVVLCYLEGRTNEEAAAILRWPVGTVKGRLARARELLRSRLTRRGLAISAMFLASRLSRNTVFADVVPLRLLELTSRNALAITRGGASAAISPSVLELIDDSLAAPLNLNPNLKFAARALSPAAAVTLLVGALALFGFLNMLTKGQGPRSRSGGRVVPASLTAEAPVTPGNCHTPAVP